MNKKIKNHLIAYCESKGWGTTDKDLAEVLIESKTVYQEKISSHRWFDIYFKVVNINGMDIGFNDYYMTGDANARDMDLDFKEDSVCEVEKKQKTIDYYTRIIP